MSTAEVIAHQPIRRLNRGEYAELNSLGWFTDERIELLEGVITEMAPQGPEHQWSVMHATEYLVRTLASRAYVRVQMPIGVTGDSEPEPDFAIVPRQEGIIETPQSALLVIEVSDSTLRRDREIKAGLYARAKIPEYWIIDVNRRVVEVHTKPVDGAYTRMDTFDRAAKVQPVSFPDLELDLQHFIPPSP